MKGQPRERIPELDGFRVLLIFVVSWYHIWQQSWLPPSVGDLSLDFLIRAGYVPVDGTILLSGFLLYLPCVTEQGRTAPPVGRFYRRRAARILPSFLFVTLFMLLAVYVLPLGVRINPWNPPMSKDLITHLTLTFTFFSDTYQASLLGGASWTIAVEAVFYLFFPWIARLARRMPGTVLCGMAMIAAFFRCWCLYCAADYGMVVNQTINMLDLYALGMACAMIWPHLRRLRERTGWKRGWHWQAAATATLIASVWVFTVLMRRQAYVDSEELQAWQMLRRPLFGLCFAGMILSMPLCVMPLRVLLGNPVTRFLSMISMNYYLLHQNIATLLKASAVRDFLETPRAWLGGQPILFSEFANPCEAYDRPWQIRYTWLCFGLSLLAAVLVTFLVEKPCAALILRPWRKRMPPPDDLPEENTKTECP